MVHLQRPTELTYSRVYPIEKSQTSSLWSWLLIGMPHVHWVDQELAQNSGSWVIDWVTFTVKYIVLDW